MPILVTSFRRKILVTLGAVAAFVVLYQASIHDSHNARETPVHDPTTSGPMAGSKLQFVATGYCVGTKTASGVNVRTGIAAADPALLPVGSVVSVTVPDAKYSGVYTIMDTGPEIQGRDLDLYFSNCEDAINFGRKNAIVTVVRLGWNPKASTPGLIDRLFRRRDFDRASRPPEVPVETAAPDAMPAQLPAQADAPSSEPPPPPAGD
ncbi:MAG: 3D domain-containing protein [Vicinamibacterales bacterium]